MAGDVDTETFSLQQYFKLLTEGQTVALDMLFNPWPETATPLWGHIVRNREKLLTKKSAAFVGYCRQQANKYGIKGSRVAAAKEAMERFRDLMEQAGTTAKVGDFFFGEDSRHRRVHVHDDKGNHEGQPRDVLRLLRPDGRVQEHGEGSHSIYSHASTEVW